MLLDNWLSVRPLQGARNLRWPLFVLSGRFSEPQLYYIRILCGRMSAVCCIWLWKCSKVRAS